MNADWQEGTTLYDKGCQVGWISGKRYCQNKQQITVNEIFCSVKLCSTNTEYISILVTVELKYI